MTIKEVDDEIKGIYEVNKKISQRLFERIVEDAYNLGFEYGFEEGLLQRAKVDAGDSKNDD